MTSAMGPSRLSDWVTVPGISSNNSLLWGLFLVDYPWLYESHWQVKAPLHEHVLSFIDDSGLLINISQSQIWSSKGFESKAWSKPFQEATNNSHGRGTWPDSLPSMTVPVGSLGNQTNLIAGVIVANITIMHNQFIMKTAALTTCCIKLVSGKITEYQDYQVTSMSILILSSDRLMDL